MLASRLKEAFAQISQWAKPAGTDAFRLYSQDVFAIDFYAGRFCLHYFAPSKAVPEPPPELIKEVASALKTAFGASEEAIFWRTRVRSHTTRQYEKRGSSKAFFVVHEYGTKFWVNLIDYLDTGLFLDHRETRHIIAKRAAGKRLLNLFAYTGAFSVQAAMSGASFTKSVDLSNTYCDWCRDNFILNNLPLTTNEIVRADCLKFLPQERAKYDLIVIDPPTISRSKKMAQLFDIQLDYISLIQEALRLLNPGGAIFFSTNSRKFTLDTSLFPGATFTEISDQLIPEDFKGAKLHRCWEIS